MQHAIRTAQQFWFQNWCWTWKSVKKCASYDLKTKGVASQNRPSFFGAILLYFPLYFQQNILIFLLLKKINANISSHNPCGNLWSLGICEKCKISRLNVHIVRKINEFLLELTEEGRFHQIFSFLANSDFKWQNQNLLVYGWHVLLQVHVGEDNIWVQSPKISFLT